MIIDGQKIAREIEAGLKIMPPPPTLAILVLPDDKAGQTYTRLKQEAAERLGIKVAISQKPAVLKQWAVSPQVNGILIQYPGWRGKKFDNKWRVWVAQIPPQKDVDGLRADSLFTPATVRAVESILKNISGRGKILVVGRGMVGRAAAKKLNAENISSRDPGLAEKVLTADILITACGRKNLIKAVKPGATVIDCGWPKGDADFAAIKDIAAAITPVPGGVGPVTVACLLENLVEARYNRL